MGSRKQKNCLRIQNLSENKIICIALFNEAFFTDTCGIDQQSLWPVLHLFKGRNHPLPLLKLIRGLNYRKTGDLYLHTRKNQKPLPDSISVIITSIRSIILTAISLQRNFHLIILTTAVYSGPGISFMKENGGWEMVGPMTVSHRKL